MASEGKHAEDVPGYIQCVQDIYRSFSGYVDRQNSPVSQWPGQFWRDLLGYAHVTSQEVLTVLALAFLFTGIRWFLTLAVYKPFGKWVLMTPLNQSKLPESGFKVLYYIGAWSACSYLLFFSNKYDYFSRPNYIWEDWKVYLEVPRDIYWLYMVQFSFYLHSMYGTIYMDRWRKDSAVMLFHHLLTMALIGFSYAARYHKIGLLVLFMHDIADICLEFTKCNVYMKDRGGKYYAIYDHISSVGFLAFSTSWFVFRLYWFPLKVLYSAGHGVIVRPPDVPLPEGTVKFYVFFNVMLWVLQILNIYWFMFIVNFLYKVVTGQMTGVEDVREEEVLEKITKTNKEKTSPHHAVNGEGEPVANGLVKEKPGRAKMD